VHYVEARLPSDADDEWDCPADWRLEDTALTTATRCTSSTWTCTLPWT